MSDVDTGLAPLLCRTFDAIGLTRRDRYPEEDAEPVLVPVGVRLARLDTGDIELEGPWGNGRDVCDERSLSRALLARLTRYYLDSDVVEPRMHAGAVAAASGAAVVVLGPSGAGKSTLIANLVHAGYDLVNDEQVSLHYRHERVGGFTRPVAVKTGGARWLPSGVASRFGEGEFPPLLSVADLGGHHQLSAQPKLVLVLDRSDGTSISWEQLEPAEAVETFCANNLDLVRKPVEAFRAFAWLATSVPTLRLHYSDARGAVEAISRLTADAPEPSKQPWEVSLIDTDSGDLVGDERGVLVRTDIGEKTLLFQCQSRELARLDRGILDS